MHRALLLSTLIQALALGSDAQNSEKSRCFFCPTPLDTQRQIRSNCVAHRFEQLTGQKAFPSRIILEGISAKLNQEYILTYEWLQRFERPDKSTFVEEITASVDMRLVRAEIQRQGGRSEILSTSIQVIALSCSEGNNCVQIKQAIRQFQNEPIQTSSIGTTNGINLICSNADELITMLSGFE